MIFGCFQARGTPKNNICCIWTAIAKAFGESQKSWFLAFWYQKMNLSFKMWFFGLKSIKIVSFDQKLHFVQKNCLKNALGRVYEKFNFGSFGHFWHFLLFSCLKVGWITQQNNEKIEPSKTRFYCGFLVDIALIFTKNEFLMTFWVPRSPVVPQKQHMLRFGSLCDGLEQEPKIMILSYLGLWAFWCQKSNLSFKMWFFGLKSMKIVSFDQKLHFV